MMGSFLGKAMDENMQKQQAFMLETQRDMLERQIQMQNYMREQAASMQLARAREMFNWWAAFYGVVFVAGVTGFRRLRKPAPLIPLLPLTFIVGYQADLCYGNKMDRIRESAQNILAEEYGLISLPQGLPRVPLLDSRRQALSQEK